MNNLTNWLQSFMRLCPVIDYKLDQIRFLPLTIACNYLALALVFTVSLLLDFVNNSTTLSDFINNIFMVRVCFLWCHFVLSILVSIVIHALSNVSEHLGYLFASHFVTNDRHQNWSQQVYTYSGPRLMLSWKVSMTSAIFCISFIEFLHSIYCISLTGVQLGLLVPGWTRSWSLGFNPDIKDLSLFCAFMFTSRTCWGLLFLLLANACLFSSLIWSEFDSFIYLLNACLWDSLVFFFFQYFLISLLAELCFAYFWTHYFFSLLPCIPSNKLSFSVLWLQLLSRYYLWFYSNLLLTVVVDCWKLLWKPIPVHWMEQLKLSVPHQEVQLL